ncbi:MAG: hypothetical protein LUG49_05635 [Oscillospiraceae bacterium]|nr:hypothetical protein [Oscillospiraceae bacterium]
MDKKQYEEQLIANIITSLEKHGAKGLLSSVIMTGSFGRKEPTYEHRDDGKLVLKSDVEIALVYPSFTKKADVDSLIESVSSEFKEELNLMGITEKRVRNAYNFNFSLKVPEYKTIFTYDLFNGSYTVWGTDFIGSISVPLESCDIYEAKRLVANRIGELVYNEKNAEKDQKEYLRKQWKGKLVLAMVSGWLICEKQYVSSYHGQYDAIHKKEKAVKEIFGKEFINEYEKVFMFLREDGQTYEVADNKLRGYVKAINTYFRDFGIGMPRVNSLSRNLKYFMKYVKNGMGYGLVGFENNILQGLIDEYCESSDGLEKTADTWHKVIY